MFSKLAILALLPTAFAATKTVTVGGPNAAQTFNPTTVKAKNGDQVKFVFAANNHTVTSGGGQGANQGCQPDGNFYSGFVPVPSGAAGQLASFTITSNGQPQAVYCSQATHCQNGMVMVINPSNDNNNPNSLVQVQRAAAKAQTNVVPTTGVTGGTLANAPQTNAGNGNGNGNGTATATGNKGKGRKAKKANKKAKKSNKNRMVRSAKFLV
jgi:plastocyanin